MIKPTTKSVYAPPKEGKYCTNSALKTHNHTTQFVILTFFASVLVEIGKALKPSVWQSYHG